MVVDKTTLQWPNEPTQEPDPNQYPLSASGTKKYKSCPKKFKLRYIDDVPSTSGSSPYAALGNAVHESIEEILDHEVDLKDKPNQLKQMMLGRYREKDPDIPDDMYDDGLSCIEVAARYIAMRDVDHWKGIEDDFIFSLARPDIDHSFRGFMDVCTDREVWDWKTGKVREEDEILQGMVYAMGYYQEYGKIPDKIRFIYLKKEKERAIDPTDENWQFLLDYARAAIEGKRNNVFPAKPDSSKCYWCSREGFCGASAVGAGGVSWETF